VKNSLLLSTYKSKYEKSRLLNDELEEKYNKLQNEYESKNKDNEKLTEKAVYLINENSRLNTEINNLEDENSDLNNEIKDLSIQIKKKDEYIDFTDYQNYITAVYSIRNYDLDEKIQLLNYEVRDLDNSIFEFEESPNKDEIKNSCIMLFNKKKVKFRFKFKFFKPGKYTFKFIFQRNLTNASHLFYGCTNLVYIDLTHFNTKYIKDMSSMFEGCILLKTLNLSTFNTSKVEFMDKMFKNCEKLRYLNILNFNTINVENTYQMFQGVNDYCKIITKNLRLLREKKIKYESSDDNDDDNNDCDDDDDKFSNI
jgi:surface protein